MNQAGFAAHRGVSRKTVTHWKQRGLLYIRPDGSVDVEASDELLRGHGIVFPADRVSRTCADTSPVSSDGEWSKAEAERVKENYAARLKKLQFEREVAVVVEIDDVVTAVAGEYGIVRDRLKRIAPDVAPSLAILKNAEEIKAAIDSAVIAALADLSDLKFDLAD